MGGVDKALIDVGGRTMLDRVLAALEPHCEELIVIGPVRETTIERVCFTVEPEPGGGPVPAIAAGLDEAAGADTVVVLAVDLPLLTANDIARLMQALEEDVDAAAAADHRGKPNPLLAVYAAEPLRAVARALGSGNPAAKLLPTNVAIIDLGEAGTLNVNEPADLQRVRERFRPGP